MSIDNKAPTRRRFHIGIVRDAAFLAAADADAREDRTNRTFDHLEDDWDGEILEALLQKMPKGTSEDDVINILQDSVEMHSTLSIKLTGFADSILPVGSEARDTCEIPEDLIDYILPYYDDALEAYIDSMIQHSGEDGEQRLFENRDQIRNCLLEMERLDNVALAEPEK